MERIAYYSGREKKGKCGNIRKEEKKRKEKLWCTRGAKIQLLSIIHIYRVLDVWRIWSTDRSQRVAMVKRK